MWPAGEGDNYMQFNGIRERMRLWPRSKRGAVLVFVAVVLVVALGFGALVVDLGFLTLTRTQLQSAADAAALAGALELAKSSGSKSSAESKAIEMAAYNKAFVGSKGSFRNSLAPVAITENDITFPEANSIRVETHRTDETNDPLRTYFLAITNTVSGRISEVTASAEASWVSICGASCLKPWCPPDRWYDADGDGEFDPYEEDDGKGKGKGKGKGGGGASEPDFYDPVLTGYKAPDDVGVQIQIKLSKQSEDMKSAVSVTVALV